MTQQMGMTVEERRMIGLFKRVLDEGYLHPDAKTFNATTMTRAMEHLSNGLFQVQRSAVICLLDRMGVFPEPRVHNRRTADLRRQLEIWLPAAQQPMEVEAPLPPTA